MKADLTQPETALLVLTPGRVLRIIDSQQLLVWEIETDAARELVAPLTAATGEGHTRATDDFERFRLVGRGNAGRDQSEPRIQAGGLPAISPESSQATTRGSTKEIRTIPSGLQLCRILGEPDAEFPNVASPNPG